MINEVLDLNVKLKVAMLEAGLSNKQLAEMVGIHAPNMSAIANGGKTPHLKTAQRIVRALNRTGKVNVAIDDIWPLEE